jgi:hypothetical protein
MRALLLLIILAPTFTLSQKLKINEFDRFTKQRHIELEPLLILSSPKANVYMTYNAIGSTLTVQFSGFGWGAFTIDPGEEAIFLFSNDTTITVKSVALQTYEIALTSLQNTYKHSYFIKPVDIKFMAEHDLIGIRKYSSGTHADMKLTKERAERIKRLSALFLEELRIAKVTQGVQEINKTDVSKYIGDSVRFCSKVYNTRFFESGPNKPTLLDVNDNLSNGLLNIVIWEGDRKNFDNAPEILYNNKDVCITGVVELENNIPQIVIRSRDQIKMKTPISVSEIAKFVGDSVTVQGKVIAGKFTSNAQNTPTLLNLGTSNQLITLVIDNKDRAHFNAAPETYYLNKHISVTGKIEMSNNQPQMLVKNPSQIVELPAPPVEADKQPEPTNETANRNEPVTAKPDTRSNNKTKVTTASFPGGHEALSEFLKNNLVWPDDEPDGDGKKIVVAKFLINPDGTATNFRIVNPTGTRFEREVIKVLKQMPKWEPHMENGVAVPISVTQPVTISRQDTANTN